MKCIHCDADVSESEALTGWCDACGKQLPASVVAGLRKAARRHADPPEVDSSPPPQPERPKGVPTGSPLGNLLKSYKGSVLAHCLIAGGLLLFALGICILVAASKGEFPPPLGYLAICTLFASLFPAFITLRALLFVRGTRLDLYERGLTFRVRSWETSLAYADIESVTVRTGEFHRVIVRLRDGGKCVLKRFSPWSQDYQEVFGMICDACGSKPVTSR